MDDKFRLVFGWTDRTPAAQDYTGPEASIYATLREAVIAGHADATPTYLPFIAHRHIVFDSHMIAVLHAELVAAKPEV